LVTPLRANGGAVGGIVIRRREARPFAEHQVTQLDTFARLAAVVIENARLNREVAERNRELNERNAELREALERETATAEVLKTISRSAFDLQAVLDTVVENAARLCGATRGNLHRIEGDLLPVIASY